MAVAVIRDVTPFFSLLPGNCICICLCVNHLFFMNIELFKLIELITLQPCKHISKLLYICYIGQSLLGFYQVLLRLVIIEVDGVGKITLHRGFWMLSWLLRELCCICVWVCNILICIGGGPWHCVQLRKVLWLRAIRFIEVYCIYMDNSVRKTLLF